MLRKFTSDEIENYLQFAKNLYKEANLPEHLIEKLLLKKKDQFDFMEEEIEQIEKTPTIISMIQLVNKTTGAPVILSRCIRLNLLLC